MMCKRFFLPLLAISATASAQDVRVVPEAGEPDPPSAIVSHTCDHGSDMAVPLSLDIAPVPMPDLALDGPEPVPMPNFCDDVADRVAAADLERFLDRSRAYRFRDAPGLPNGLRDADPFELRDRWLPYPDLHGPTLPLQFDRPPLPDVELPSDILRLPQVDPPDDRP